MFKVEQNKSVIVYLLPAALAKISLVFVILQHNIKSITRGSFSSSSVSTAAHSRSRIYLRS